MKTLLFSILATSTAFATISAQDLHYRKIVYEIAGTQFESTIVHQAEKNKDRPGILMVPNWMGPTEDSLEKARMLAADDYLVMMVDMYGVDVRPSNAAEASAAAGSVRSDRDKMRRRAAKALEVFKAEAAPHGLDTSKIAAIGFCFGGGAVLELGRSGVELDALVSFHGDLISPTLRTDAGNTKAKVLVLHGADDPYVPQSDVQEFVEVMQDTDVDWQLLQYSNTVHSFTDPTASSDGAHYNEKSAARSFAAMRSLFEELW